MAQLTAEEMEPAVVTALARSRVLEALPKGFSEQGLLTYEQRLSNDSRWALIEGSTHFDENNSVFKALRKIANRLHDLKIPYAVVGGLALFKHGYRRFTEDVDILVTKEDLRRIHAELEGLGYLPPYAGGKHLRDVELGVKIEFLTTGEFPGDGNRKPVSFPLPSDVGQEIDGILYVNLPTLIELKLASGMTGQGRRKDLSDVVEVIKTLRLSADFAEQLNPFVREQYLELWNEGKARYQMTWRNKWLTAEAKTIEDMIASLRAAADRLDEMRTLGVTLKQHDSVRDDYATLQTDDPEVAKKFEMEEEREYLESRENEADPRQP